MKKLRNAFFWLVRNWEEVIVTFAVTIMLVICSYNVFSRYCLNMAISWSQEICIICLVYITFVGSAAAYKRNMHYGMDFLVDSLQYKAAYVLRVVLTFVLVVLFAYLTYISTNYTIIAKKLMDVTRLPYKIIDSAVVLGFGSMTIYSVIYLVQGIFYPEKFKNRYFKCEPTNDAQGMEAQS